MAPQVELLENLRFDPGEEQNDPTFVDKLINGHDAYVNDAFGVSHRAHASVVGPPTRLPSAAGFLLQREIEALGGLLGAPARPFVAVVGGAKIADKLGVLKALLDRVDALVVGGGMAFTFLAACGHDVGGSMVDEDRIPDCVELLKSGKPILLPTDIVALEPAADFGCDCTVGRGPRRGGGHPRRLAGAGYRTGHGGGLRRGRSPAPARCCGTGPWASSRTPGSTRHGRGGPGRRRLRRLHRGGGGDSAAAVDELGLVDQIDFISTGGGASLELLEYGDLPGLAALRQAPNAPAAGVALSGRSKR